jgi:hypothetical protein
MTETAGARGGLRGIGERRKRVVFGSSSQAAGFFEDEANRGLDRPKREPWRI